ncbi:Inactive leucine-rich repeat receptor-like serine/threonine-protein kinase [Zea mays]|uniref:Inactive leucine-rich repeat receptor-like serine/threonine-protein kinase n=1 Tax=Zea mays TaxID=4577 RepID=A0A1D6HQ81_MAIZE|nr:Inactive leucine-rich repeat receptor-like serine/threonine-protein kinase [Zea mays]
MGEPKPPRPTQSSRPATLTMPPTASRGAPTRRPLSAPPGPACASAPPPAASPSSSSRAST